MRPVSGTRLIDLVCVLDVAYMLVDIWSADYVGLTAMGGECEGGILTSRAELLVSQIEFSSTIAIVNSGELETAELEQAASLLSHLAPSADQCLIADSDRVHGEDRRPFAKRPPDAGWVSILNEEFTPKCQSCVGRGLSIRAVSPVPPWSTSSGTDLVPLPGALWSDSAFGRFCPFGHPSAHHRPMGSGGRVLHALSIWHLMTGSVPMDEVSGVWSGRGVHRYWDSMSSLLRRVLDNVALSDAELAAGPMVWADFPDQFPDWSNGDDVIRRGHYLFCADAAHSAQSPKISNICRVTSNP